MDWLVDRWGRMDPPAPTLFALLITPVTIPLIPQYHTIPQYQPGHELKYSVGSHHHQYRTRERPIPAQ